MRYSNKRFKKHIRKFGFRIKKIPFRKDILSVQYMNKHLMVIPVNMYAFLNALNVDMGGRQHPDYFDCERKAIDNNFRVKRTNYLDESWYYERLEASQK